MIKLKNSIISNICTLVVVFLLGGSLPAQSASRLYDFFASDVGLVLLRDTALGRELVEKILGRRLVDVTRDLPALRSRLERPDVESVKFKGEIETRILEFESEFQARLRVSPGLGAGDRQALIEELSSRFFDFSISSGQGGLAAAQAAFVNAGTGSMASFAVEPGSIEARLAPSDKIDERLVQLEYKYYREKHLLQPRRMADELKIRTGSQRVTLRQMVEHILESRVEMARELLDLSKVYQGKEPFLSSTLEKASHEVGVSEGARNHFAEKASALEAIEYVDGSEFEDLNGYTSKLRGEMGELRAAVRLAGVSERGLRIGQLGRYFGQGPLGDAARAELAALEVGRPEIFQKELDLIFEGGLTWGEVKSYGSRLSRQSQNYFKVMEQARKTVGIKALIERSPAMRAALAQQGRLIELRIYFVAGVTDGVAAELEALGYQVFGIR
ncbi:hypothetical protein WDW37_11320 [Bdellovibrionota bacterium FG-1]